MAADLVNQISIGSQTGNVTGSAVQFLSNTQRTAWVNVQTTGSVTVTISAGHSFNDVTHDIDIITYESGTSINKDTFSYNMDFPFMNATTSNEHGTTTTSVTFTGRGT